LVQSGGIHAINYINFISFFNFNSVTLFRLPQEDQISVSNHSSHFSRQPIFEPLRGVLIASRKMNPRLVMLLREPDGFLLFFDPPVSWDASESKTVVSIGPSSAFRPFGHQPPQGSL